MGAISTLPRDLWVFFILRFTKIRNLHPDNLALCGALIGTHCLRINIPCDPAVRVP